MLDETLSTTEKKTEREDALVFSPDLDIVEKRDAFEVDADVPGADLDTVKIGVENDVLTLRATVAPLELEGLPLLHQEYQVGDYEASLRISEQVDVDKIAAQLKDGVITLTLPKREEQKPRRIEVKAA